MKTVNVHEAKTQLSKLIAAAERGEDVIIAKAGKPVVRLVAVQSAAPQPRRGGFMKGQIWIAPDFDAPLPADVQAAFEGKADEL
jgi:prevent-host-death family protein